MKEGPGTHPAIIGAVIAGTATILAAFLPRVWDRFHPSGREAEPAAVTTDSSAGPASSEPAAAPAAGPAAWDEPDSLADAWGEAIARMNHANAGAVSGQLAERIDTQGDGYPELQREDRDGDGAFDLYRVDVDGDNATDYYFAVEIATGRVFRVPPR